MLTQIAIHEGHEIMGLRVIRIPSDGVLQRYESELGEAAVVQHFPTVEPSDGIVWILIAGAGQPVTGGIEPSARLLGQTELEHRRHIARVLGEQRLELSDGVLVPPQAGIRAAQLPSGIAVVWLPACLGPEVGDAALKVPTVPVGDLQVGLGHLHLGVELQGAGKFRDRLVDQTLLVIKNAEVIVRPGVGRIDPLGEGAENREIALRQRGGRHDR
jgi:hypothetical protein